MKLLNTSPIFSYFPQLLFDTRYWSEYTYWGQKRADLLLNSSAICTQIYYEVKLINGSCSQITWLRKQIRGLYMLNRANQQLNRTTLCMTTSVSNQLIHNGQIIIHAFECNLFTNYYFVCWFSSACGMGSTL